MKVFFLIIFYSISFISPLIYSQDSLSALDKNIAWQISLEKWNFSTGMIDGIWGPNSQRSFEKCIQAKKLSHLGFNKNSLGLQSALEVDLQNIYIEYVITEEDLKAITAIPKNWIERSNLQRMGYETLAELVREKYHCSLKLLKKLNPQLDFTEYEVGTKLKVPFIQKAKVPSITSLEIDLDLRTLSGFDHNNDLVLFFLVSVARSKKKLPERDAFVKNKALHPNYTFNPLYWPEIDYVDRILIIPPGPKNPVGEAWIGLDLPGYGIHGTPIPENVGKTGSHGCFRLTNWNARHLLSAVNIGMQVRMVKIEDRLHDKLNDKEPNQE